MLKIIKNCPSCSSILKRIGPNLICLFQECPAKSTKIVENFATKMGIKGLGPITIKKLGLTKIFHIYIIPTETLKQELGDKITAKLISEISKSKNVSVGKFLSSCSIPLIGKTAGNKLDTIVDNIEDISMEVCKKVGLGDKASSNLINWINTTYKETLSFIPMDFKKLEQSTSTYKVCISGKIPGYTKSKIKEILSKYKIETKDSVTKDLDFLISEEDNTSKANKAKQYNIPIISFKKFKEEIINGEVD